MQVHSNGFKTTRTYFASDSDSIKTKCVYRKLRGESDFYSVPTAGYTKDRCTGV